MIRTGLEDHPLIRYLCRPESATNFESGDWESLFRSARKGDLLSRVAWLAKHVGLIERIPEKVALHMQGALRVSESQSVSARWEVTKVQAAFAESRIPFILLKGAAYIVAQLDAGHGRLLSDVDIMVPTERLADAEKALYRHGWFSTKLDPYDQRYYREWMHELPPMQHLDRGTSLDVHHTILPPTARLKPEVDRLWSQALEIEKMPGIYVLSPTDMVLHSATHLFHEGEYSHGLRDLVDIDSLIRQFSAQPRYFDKLIDRAKELDLSRPLYYALRYCVALLNAPVPPNIISSVNQHQNQSLLIRKLMDHAVLKSVGAILDVRPSYATALAEFSMYVRSHYLRMPMHQLIPHLLRKQVKRKA